MYEFLRNIHFSRWTYFRVKENLLTSGCTGFEISLLSFFNRFRKNLNPRKSAKISKKNSESHAIIENQVTQNDYRGPSILNYIRKVKCHSNSQRDFQGLIKTQIPYTTKPLKRRKEPVRIRIGFTWWRTCYLTIGLYLDINLYFASNDFS